MGRKEEVASRFKGEKSEIPDIQLDKLQLTGQERLEYEVLSDTKVKLDNDKAAAYIDLPIFEGERNVTDGHVQTLYDEMRRGNFNELLVVLSTCELKGVTYKVNGQHTCWAKMFMPESYAPTVREIRYRVKTDEQLRNLYAVYDRGKVRTEGHLTKIKLVNTPAAEGIWSSNIEKLTAGMKYWLYPNKQERMRIRDSETAALVKHQHGQVFQNVGRFLQEHHDARHLVRQPVIGAMFDNFNKVPTIAPDFWEKVATGLGLDDKRDPRYHLREFLTRVVMQKSPSASLKRLADSEEIYRICVQAWNHWRKGGAVQMLRPTKERVKSA